MRDIKLRVWDSKNKLMLNPDESVENNLSVPACDYNYNYAEYLQYTGLKDINGVEIYEGDIVEFESYSIGAEDFKGVVEFDCGQFFVKIKNEHGKEDGESIFNELGIFTIIGNIYENPELLLEK